jgi:hypothetical protein
VTAIEDIRTARLVRKAKRAIAAGQETVLPKRVVDRLAAGENPVRVLREWRDIAPDASRAKTILSLADSSRKS